MKVNIIKHELTPVGTIVEVPEGQGEYMVKSGQAEIVEQDSDVAHDMGSVPESANAKIPEKIVKQEPSE